MKVLLLVLVLIALLVCYSGISFFRKVQVSRGLIAHTVPFSLAGERTVSILVLGDSTAVGVGASSSQDSLAGLLARAVGATSVDNFAVSGARVRDLAREVQQIRKEKYNYILVGIGANDVVRFGDANDVADHLKVILDGLPKHDRLVVYMGGNLGATKLFPYILRPRLTRRSLEFHEAFTRVVTAAGGTYVNLYTPPADDLFVSDPATYLATDSFHPSSAGYAVWFKKIQTVL